MVWIKNLALSVLMMVGVMISVATAADIPVVADAEITTEVLGNFAAELELNLELVEFLKNNSTGAMREALSELKEALIRFDKAFYTREVLVNYCDDPKDMTRASDILSAAYRKDLVSPFADSYNLKLLPLVEVDAGLAAVNTLSDLKAVARYEEVIEMVKTGRLHFRTNCPQGYAASVKAHVRKFIVKKMEAAFLAKFAEQTGLNMEMKDMDRRYAVMPNYMGYIGSYLTVPKAKETFIHLPNIQFIAKN